MLLPLLLLLLFKIFEDDPDVDDVADADDVVGGEDDRDVELEQADATSDDPFDEFPLELAAQLMLVLLLSTTSDSFSIRCRLMTGCSLLWCTEGDGDDEAGADIMTMASEELDPLPVVTATTDDGAGGGPVGRAGPKLFRVSFSFCRTMESRL